MYLIRSSTRWRGALLVLAIGLGDHGTAAAQGATTMGPSGAPGGGIFGSSARAGGPSIHGGQLPGRGSLIGDGMGGFTIYQGRSRSRFLGPAEGPGTVHHQGGGTSRVIGDGSGGATVHGPTGTHRHWGAPRRDFSDMR